MDREELEGVVVVEKGFEVHPVVFPCGDERFGFLDPRPIVLTVAEEGLLTWDTA
jgi:hypothetical protein